MMETDDEDTLLRSVALQNSQSILQARQRAEQELLAAKEALRESNERISNILESITDGFAVLDFSWRFTYLNPRAEEIIRPLRKSRNRLLGANFWQEFPDLQGTGVEQEFCRALQERVTVEFEVFYPPMDGWLQIRAYPSRDGLSIYFQDITRRKKAEEELRHQREWFQVTLSSIGDAVITTDVHGKVTFLNPVAETLTGWTSREASGQQVETVFHIINEKTGLSAINPIREVLREGLVIGLANHTCLIARDGTQRAIEDSAAPITSATGATSGAVMVFRDVTDKRRAEEVLRENTELVHATFHQAAVGIAIARLDGRFVEMNRRFAEILGYAPDELLNMTSIDITHPADVARTEAEVQRLLRGEIAEYTLEKRYLRKNKSVVWSLTRVTRLKDADGEPRRLIGVIEDITERKHAEDSERAARSEAERSNRVKDDFLATLSHELRTPLSAILGWTYLLRQKSLQESEFRQALDTIERNARIQTQLIDDLLDMSRITSGKMRLDIQTVEPAAFVEAAVQTVRPAAAAKGVRLETSFQPDSGLIQGDPGRLQQVIWNLLANAVKFTPKDGGIRVNVERVDAQLEIRVTDTGAGIAPEFLPHVFERFRQADSSTTRKHGGLGLGLSIVKRLAELHGGSVIADSAGLGRGAVFTVRLPLSAVHPRTYDDEGLRPTEIRPIASDFSVLDLTGLKVVVVDDEADACELVKRLLCQCGADVATATKAEDAIALVERERPDVLVSDIGMPDMDGFELLRRVRSLGQTRGGKVPAVALTAYTRPEDRTRAIRAGFLAHLSKPVEPSELIAIVASVAGRPTGEPIETAS